MDKLVPKKKHDTTKIKNRKKADVNGRDVYELAKIHCTVEEIASFLQVSKQTLYNRFKAQLRDGWQASKMKLRRKLHKMAVEDGNYKVAIWLSKQYLGMRDVQPDEATQVQFNVYTNEVPK